MDEISSLAPSGGRLARLIDPRSVVIVGASDKLGSLGSSVLRNLERNGFSGDIHLVNPRRAEIHGRVCFARIAELPLDVDAAILAIPRSGVADAVSELAASRVGAAIVFSAGFAEDGAAGLREQRAIAETAARKNMVLLGPNCLGLVNHQTGAALTFVETETHPPDPAGQGIGVVSQSGAMAAVLGTVLGVRSLPMTLSVSTGNEAGSGVEDYVEWLVGDARTRVIAMIVEQFRSPVRFLDAARAAHRAGKVIVLLHPGRSQAARDSAATHTGAMAGDHEVMRAFVREAGVILVETLEELSDVVEIAYRSNVASLRRVAVVGESGAFKALTLDLAQAIELPLPALSDDDAPGLRAALPEFVHVSNPLDLTAQGLVDPDLYTRVITALVEDPRVGAILLAIILTDPATIAIKLPPIIAALDERPGAKPVIFAALDDGARLEGDQLASLRAHGVAFFPSSERTMRASARLAAAKAPSPGAESRSIALELPSGGGWVVEHRSKALLATAGIAFPRGRLAVDAETARTCAKSLGFPVVLKAQAAGLPHKSDVGGVAVGLADGDDLMRSQKAMAKEIARHRPDLELEGYLVEAMVPPGVELILGGRRDPAWGPVVLAGFGGVQAEILKDVRLITPDMDRAAIEAELHRLRSTVLFDGWRGTPQRDVGAAIDLIETIRAVLLGNPRILELDLNPVVLNPVGEGAVALDALLLLAP